MQDFFSLNCIFNDQKQGPRRTGERIKGEIENPVGGEPEEDQGGGRGDHLQLLGWLWTPENCHHEEGQQHLSVPVQSS